MLSPIQELNLQKKKKQKEQLDNSTMIQKSVLDCFLKENNEFKIERERKVFKKVFHA